MIGVESFLDLVSPNVGPKYFPNPPCGIISTPPNLFSTPFVDRLPAEFIVFLTQLGLTLVDHGLI